MIWILYSVRWRSSGNSQGQNVGEFWTQSGIHRHWDFPYYPSDPQEVEYHENQSEVGLWSEQWDERKLRCIRRMKPQFYISPICIPFPHCHLFAKINISLALALLMIPMLAIPATMSFKGDTDTYKMLCDNNTAPGIHVDSKGRGQQRQGWSFRAVEQKTMPFFIISSLAFVLLKRNIYLFLKKKKINPGIGWHLKFEHPILAIKLAEILYVIDKNLNETWAGHDTYNCDLDVLHQILGFIWLLFTVSPISGHTVAQGFMNPFAFCWQPLLLHSTTF